MHLVPAVIVISTPSLVIPTTKLRHHGTRTQQLVLRQYRTVTELEAFDLVLPTLEPVIEANAVVVRIANLQRRTLRPKQLQITSDHISTETHRIRPIQFIDAIVPVTR